MVAPVVAAMVASEALSVVGGSLTTIAKVIQGLYGFAGDINTAINDHLSEMLASDNPTIERTGRIIDAAKCGFGLGYISSLAIITTGQLLLGHPIAAAITAVQAGTGVALFTNPIAMTCAAVGAIIYGWSALNEKERNDILAQITEWLGVGAELIKSIISFVISKSKELLDATAAALSEMLNYIGSGAELFGKSLYKVTGKLSHKLFRVKNVFRTDETPKPVAEKQTDDEQNKKKSPFYDLNGDGKFDHNDILELMPESWRPKTKTKSVESTT